VLRLLLVVILAGVVNPDAGARLGETHSQLSRRFGRSQPETQKKTALWFFEVADGRLAYNVTFNAKGHSIAEGLKPVKQAVLTRSMAEDFIRAQLEPYAGSTTTRTLKAGEKYTFAGREFTCGPSEVVIVDDPNDILLIWNQADIRTIMVVRSEMLR
jgi:hypothetical protein